MLRAAAARLREGETVTLHPVGQSMAPLIRSHDEVVIVPVQASELKVGQIVLVKVTGQYYLHLIKALDTSQRRVLIGNNHGRINGWTGFANVFGLVSRLQT